MVEPRTQEQYDAYACNAADCRVLMAAVVRRAVCDHALYRNERWGKKAGFRRDAYKWLFQGGRDHPFTFLNLCDQLDYDAKSLRRRARVMSREDALKIDSPRGRHSSTTLAGVQVPVDTMRDVERDLGL